MKPSADPATLASKIIVRGLHLDLTEALHNAALSKAERLLRHEERIIRIRIDLDHDKTRSAGTHFIARGSMEISGPDIFASAESDDAYKSLDLLVEKLDRMLRKRAADSKGKRNHPHDVDLGAPLPKTSAAESDAG
ncbi:ribosome-associated translation inhibitor RaiA [Horticoccus luteus]|uniref:Ribosome-associated translation inhibitor RaiA n=1 Tax=Horticoccus luteus TaxID=2862869 RepID=A0A8F9TVQ6_9BACT|nr:ribosome-associated translation inhibitor RaiA [Horticoccus luteus]QYM78649.1 ribosome-associated translation inhibitor RaiA [Horticoccus luteus]